jgi:hypothetical protein
MANFVTTSYFAYFIPMLPIVGFLETSIISAELKYAALPLVGLSRFNKEAADYAS